MADIMIDPIGAEDTIERAPAECIVKALALLIDGLWVIMETDLDHSGARATFLQATGDSRTRAGLRWRMVFHLEPIPPKPKE